MMQHLVTSYDLSMKMRGLGLRQESNFGWSVKDKTLSSFDFWGEEPQLLDEQYAAALTAEEIRLPAFIPITFKGKDGEEAGELEIFKSICGDYWYVKYILIHVVRRHSLAEAMGEMWCFLRERNYIVYEKDIPIAWPDLDRTDRNPQTHVGGRDTRTDGLSGSERTENGARFETPSTYTQPSISRPSEGV